MISLRITWLLFIACTFFCVGPAEAKKRKKNKRTVTPSVLNRNGTEKPKENRESPAGSSRNVSPHTYKREEQQEEEKEEEKCLCMVAQTSVMEEDPHGRRNSRHALDCLAIPGISPSTQTQLRIYDMDPQTLQTHEQDLHAGQWWIRFPCVKHKRSISAKGSGVETVRLEVMKEIIQQATASSSRRRRRRLGDNHVPLHEKELMAPRRRLSNVGTQKCGIVIVDAKDTLNPLTAAVADRTLYEETSNQFEACSNAAMRLVRQDETIRIRLPNNIDTYSDESVAPALFAAACQFYGLPETCNISSERNLDHILFSLPYGLSIDEPGYLWAYASTGDYRRFSIYSGGNYMGLNAGFFVPSTLLHE